MIAKTPSIIWMWSLEWHQQVFAPLSLCFSSLGTFNQIAHEQDVLVCAKVMAFKG